MKNTKAVLELFENYHLLKEHVDFNALSAAYDAEQANTGIDEVELESDINEYISQSVQIIYYHTAIDFLKENDPSLTDSLEKAADLGYQAKDLNSELLASILLQDMVTEEAQEFLNEVGELDDAPEAEEVA